jgi:hypothetical protein
MAQPPRPLIPHQHDHTSLTQLCTCTGTTQLVFSSNCLGAGGIAALCGLLSTHACAALEHLDLSRVLLDQHGAQSIKDFLHGPACPRLATLSLANEAFGQAVPVLTLFAGFDPSLSRRRGLTIHFPRDQSVVA